VKRGSNQGFAPLEIVGGLSERWVMKIRLAALAPEQDEPEGDGSRQVQRAARDCVIGGGLVVRNVLWGPVWLCTRIGGGSRA